MSEDAANEITPLKWEWTENGARADTRKSSKNRTYDYNAFRIRFTTSLTPQWGAMRNYADGIETVTTFGSLSAAMTACETHHRTGKWLDEYNRPANVRLELFPRVREEQARQERERLEQERERLDRERLEKEHEKGKAKRKRRGKESA